jgi:hypothetical protein
MRPSLENSQIWQKGSFHQKNMLPVEQKRDWFGALGFARKRGKTAAFGFASIETGRGKFRAEFDLKQVRWTRVVSRAGVTILSCFGFGKSSSRLAPVTPEAPADTPHYQRGWNASDFDECRSLDSFKTARDVVQGGSFSERICRGNCHPGRCHAFTDGESTLHHTCSKHVRTLTTRHLVV